MRVVLLIAVLGSGVAAAGDVSLELLKNPFDRPPLDRLEEAAAGRTVPALLDDLRATLVAETGALVNIGGRILAMGESVGEYKLVEVREGEAVFSKGAERVELVLRGDAEESDDAE